MQIDTHYTAEDSCFQHEDVQAQIVEKMCLPQKQYLVQISFVSEGAVNFHLKVVTAENYEAFEEAMYHHIDNFRPEEWKIYYYGKCGTL